MKIGILSLQGGIKEHKDHLSALDIDSIEVKTVNDLDNISGLILPGGESTSMGKILEETKLLNPLRTKILSGLPTWGTCAGMILLAKEIENETKTHLSLMDIKVRRNAYGRQINSFNTKDIISKISTEEIPLVFIRAPFIVSAGKNIEIIHKVNQNIVAARQNNMLVTSFHPELTENLEFHRYFISICSHNYI